MFLNDMNRKKNSHKSKKYASAIESKKQHIKNSNDSQEDDNDYMSNNVAFQTITKKILLKALLHQMLQRRKRQQQFLMLLKSMKTQIHQIVKILIQTIVMKMNQTLKTSKKLIEICMIIG